MNENLASVIRACVEDKAGYFAELADLPARWNALSPDACDPQHPTLSERDMLLGIYMHFAPTRRWAWDGVNRLLAALLEQNKPIPPALAYWACLVTMRRWKGELKTPRKPGKSPSASQDERDVRIRYTYRLLRAHGWTHERALGDIAEALDKPEDTIRSVFRKMRDFKPDNIPVTIEDTIRFAFRKE